MLGKALAGILAAVAAVAVGVGLGLVVSRGLDNDEHRLHTAGAGAHGGNERDEGSAVSADNRPRLTGDALGPIELGMSRRAALDTGWLGDAQETCSDIIGDQGAQPGEYNYLLGGDRLPSSLAGHVEFFDDRVSLIQVDSDVELPNALTFDSNWDNPTAERAFTSRGYSFSSGGIFDTNDSATVRSPGGDEFGMYFSYSQGSAFVSIPEVIICD